MAGIEVTEAEARPIGFAYDRRWMLIDEDHRFVSQRNEVAMAQFRPLIDGDNIVVRYDQAEVKFNINQLTGESILTQVWDDNATTREVHAEVSSWFSDHLHKKVKLVRLLDEEARIHHASTRNEDIAVSLADGYPYLIVGSASLDLLNTKLSQPILMNRFRPNIVVATSIAHEEDTWGEMSISDLSFYNVKPCGRCQVITIDQATGEINNEILKTLNTYRRQGNNVMFGTNVVCRDGGVIKVGDVINV